MEEEEDEEDEKEQDDEKTVYGSASGSKSSTRRGTLRNHVRRKLGTPGDLETTMSNSPKRSGSGPEVDKKVCINITCFHSRRGVPFQFGDN